MPSPFPGMNPYLEQTDTWEDFHHDFITRAREVLSPQVGANYFVKIEVQLYLHELSAEERRFIGKADIGVTGSPSLAESHEGTIPAPVRLEMPAVEIERHASLEIRDKRNRRLITVVEVLSPSNKASGPDRDDYLRKRLSLLAQQVNLVEIDLRRGGQRPQPLLLPACDYCVLVARTRDWPQVGVWPIRLRERLPIVPVPLADADPDVRLDLQLVLDRAYDGAEYAKYIYGETPEPPLSPEDAAWSQQFLPGLHA